MTGSQPRAEPKLSRRQCRRRSHRERASIGSSKRSAGRGGQRRAWREIANFWPSITRRDAPLCCKRRGQRGEQQPCRGPSACAAHGGRNFARLLRMQAGLGRPLFLIGRPYNGERAAPGNGQMVALLAPNRDAVDRSHARALANGARSEGEPGLRPHYHPNYYGAYFRDPDGNKLCVCCHGTQ
jgi:catechol 2,3-dioxygenase-like lactoylglutathione lyase family enzyme